MRDPVPTPVILPALTRARFRWRCAASVVASRAAHPVSSWLHDHAHRATRGTKGADQLARLMAEMDAARMTYDEQDAVLLDLTRGIRRDLHAARALGPLRKTTPPRRANVWGPITGDYTVIPYNVAPRAPRRTLAVRVRNEIRVPSRDVTLIIPLHDVQWFLAQCAVAESRHARTLGADVQGVA